MDDMKRTSEYRRMLPFIAKASNDVGDDTQGEDIQALILALNTHKSSDDHDGRYYTETEIGTLFTNHNSSGDHDSRYYTESEITSFLSGKADKAISLTAGNGLTGGGNLSADRTFAVGAGTGITVNADDVAINLAANLTWTGGHTFSGSLTTGSILPALADVYDLGDYTKPWRKIWGSELSAVVFSQYEQVLLGGWLTISKGEGKLTAAVVSTDTEIDLGAGTFATNDIIVFRGISSNGTPQVEYMKVGTLVSGTTYNVTRDLDGTGANNWPAGTVYGNWGQVGNGRVELNAYDEPRMSVYSHGAAIADFREQVRIGDLNGGWGYSSSVFGGAFGAYETGKANITIDPINGLRIRNFDQDVIKLTGTTASFEQYITTGVSGGVLAGNGQIKIDKTGISVRAVDQYVLDNSYRIIDSTTGNAVVTLQAYMDSTQKIVFSRMWTGSQTDWSSWLHIDSFNLGENPARIVLWAHNNSTAQKDALFSITCGNGIAAESDFTFQFEYSKENNIDLLADRINIGNGTRTTALSKNVNIRTSIGTIDFDSRISFYGGNGTLANGNIAIDTGVFNLSSRMFIGSKTLNVGERGIHFITNANSPSYDSRILASGGDSNAGNGSLTYTASGGHTFVGPVFYGSKPANMTDDGWIPVSSTWTYASATTITVPSGAASIYKVGQGIKLTQTTVKYFYVVGVADTLLTITGGSDYTLANAAISAVSYTNTPQTAIGFPDTFSYSVTPTYLGGTTDPTGWTTLTGKFSISGTKTTLWIYGHLDRGTGNRTFIKFNLPIVYSMETSASCTHTLLSSVFVNGVVYMTGSGMTLALGAAMANNGYAWLTTTYRI